MYKPTLFGNTQTQTQTVKPEDKDYPFHEPRIIEPPYDYLIPCVEHGFVAMKELRSHTPQIYFPKIIYEELMYLAKYTTSKNKIEAAAMLVYRKLMEEKPVWECLGYFMLPQEATGSEVNIFINPKHYDKAIDWIAENHPNVNTDVQHIGHFHVHPKMGAFFSGTDDKQQTQLSQLALTTGVRIFLVVNEKKEHKARAIQYGPLLATEDGKPHYIDNIALGISYATEEACQHLTKDRRAEIEKMVDDLVIQKKVYNYNHASGYNYKQSFNYTTYQKPTQIEQTLNDDLFEWISTSHDKFESYFKHIVSYFIGHFDNMELRHASLDPTMFEDELNQSSLHFLLLYNEVNEELSNQLISLSERVNDYLYTTFYQNHDEEYEFLDLEGASAEFAESFAQVVALMIAVETGWIKDKDLTGIKIKEWTGLSIIPYQLRELIGIIFHDLPDNTNRVDDIIEKIT